jgi:[acyl-carrier-protein] S-malonyltransferase
MTSAPFAFVFPGQGSQSVGMLDAWGGSHPEVQDVLSEASEALGEDIGKLIHDGPKEALALTINTQPVMLVAGVAAYRAWIAETGLAPSVLAGHSLGEYSALVASGALSLSQAVPLVRFRAEAMQSAVPVGVGAMAVIMGLDAGKVVAGCAQVAASHEPGADRVVEAVNFNDPLQTVIAGDKESVAQACELLKATGAKRALPLPVSAPFHSSLMRPAAVKLRQRLATTEFSMPQIPVVNNVDVMVETDTGRIRDALFRQAAAPVRWVECVRAMRGRGIGRFVECGPGKVLVGLCRRIEPEAHCAALFDPNSLRETKGMLT